MAPMTSTMASMVDSLVAPMEVSMVAPMASMVAPMASIASMVAPMAPLVASMASMVASLDWLKRMTAESKYDDERGWTHKFREELTVGLIFLDGVVQVVTWARTKRTESLVDAMALMTLIASTLAMMVASMMAMVAPMALSRSKEEKTARGDRKGIKKRCQNGRRCHGSTVALMVALMVATMVAPEASMVASMAPMASMASMVASRALVVASMASMASMVVVLLEWLNLIAAEPKRGDERVDGLAHEIGDERADELTLNIEGASTVAWMMASMVAAWKAPVASVMASRAPIASMASMVALMAPVVASLASMASMVASLDWLRLMTEPKRGEERVDGLSHKICEERVDGLTHKNL